MPNTTPSIPALDSIDTASLADVMGGCGGKRRCGGCCNTTTNVTNNFAAPAPAAPAPADSTSVSVSYA